MNKPRMIIFDYGHTLLYEPEFDFLRGDKVLSDTLQSPSTANYFLRISA